MQLTYDPRYNIAYLQLKDSDQQVETVSVSPDLNVDVAEDGTVFGIEFLNAKEQLFAIDNGELEVKNEELGTSKTLVLQP